MLFFFVCIANTNVYLHVMHFAIVAIQGPPGRDGTPGPPGADGPPVS